MDQYEELFKYLEIPRTPDEMMKYFEKIKGYVHTDNDLAKMARIKKGKFKKLLEEFYPLLCFGHSRFSQMDAKMNIVLGNQGYDAVIESPCGAISKLEITSYLDGRSDYRDALKINERGYGEVRFNKPCTLDDHASQYLKCIINNARKKSQKSYTDVCLLFVVDTRDYFHLFDRDETDFVMSLIKELSKLKFDAKDVFLMIFNEQSIDTIDKNLFKLDCI